MPSDSIAGFLDRAQANRVLFPEQVEQLIRQPDLPHSDLTALCEYLQARGVLTRFQADAIREGRGHDLNFAGYPVIDVVGPCQGGTAYRALHPSLRTPLVLRRFAPGAFAPRDTAEAVVNRARTFGTIPHPNIQPVLDAGVHDGQAYAVLDLPADASDLGTLLREVGGAMPGFLAAEYGWAVAAALRAVHERGGWHGEVRPGLMSVSPVVTKTRDDGTARRRPAPNATVKLTDVGLIPVSVPAAVDPPPVDVLTYLPPERLDGGRYDPRGDLYGLGATLYLLLSGRPPFTAHTPEELLHKVRAVEPTPLASLRPNDPPDLTALVGRLMAKRLEHRPQTAAEVCQALAPHCRPGVLPPDPAPAAIPEALPMSSVHPPALVVTPVAEELPDDEEADEPDAWGVNPNAFADAAAASVADTGQRRRRQLTDADKTKSRLWIAIGLCLHLTAVALVVAWALGVFSSPPDMAPPTEPRKSDPDQRKPPPPRPKKTKDKDRDRDS
jgi:serine/threonine protein kinase